MKKRKKIKVEDTDNFIFRKTMILKIRLLSIYLSVCRSFNHLSTEWEKEVYFIDRTKKNRDN